MCRLLTWAIPTVRKGITDMVSGFITDFGMTWYRQDFNIPPERYWELADTPDRIGMTEIGHVEGLYKMWDDCSPGIPACILTIAPAEAGASISR